MPNFEIRGTNLCKARFEGTSQLPVVRLDVSKIETLVTILSQALENEAHMSALLQPVLLRADSGGLPCYLETFVERDIPFYEDRGFRVQGAGSIPRGGPDFWAMMRPPH